MLNPVSALRFALILGAPLLGACGGHLSTQDAAERCNIERANKPTVTDEAYQACIACFEDCGDDCAAAGTTPETYRCAE
jgi:hypothetical protein